jgi:hypothetical protein
MPRISELHYSDAYAARSGIAEFVEIALGAADNPADYTVTLYQANGTPGLELRLDDPRITRVVDPDNGEVLFILSADNLPFKLTDPDSNNANNYEAVALTRTGGAPTRVIDFYDIGGGTRNITAQSGAAVGAVSENIQPPTTPGNTTTTIQWNQPNPETSSFAPVSQGDTGVACFTAGTCIETALGTRRIETLRPGDMILTLDDGPQPLRWIGIRTVAGQGAMAPVLLRAGALGATCELMVSPQHRMLVSGWRAELLFGEREVLVPAKALVDDRTILRVQTPNVTYVHLLFDAHQIVETHGVQSESFLPGSYIMGNGASEADAEIRQMFPALGPAVAGLPAARYLCTVQEAISLTERPLAA